MSRQRFRDIKRYLHVCDNINLGTEKMAKVIPIYDVLNRKLSFGILHSQLSIDKLMVPYFGKHSCKQFIRGKPIQFGYKCWMLASATGMPYNVKQKRAMKGENRGKQKRAMMIHESSEQCIRSL